jgi:D-threonate/D-erythronate kinase
MESLIFADDLTGACDAAVVFAERGFRTVAWISELYPDPVEPPPSLQIQVLALNTASRHLPAEEAASRLAEVVKWSRLHAVRTLFKKIDSLFRGNTFDEIFEIRRLFPGYLFVLAPAFPRNGRTMRNGCVQAVNLVSRPLNVHAELTSRGLSPHLIRASDSAFTIPLALAAHKHFLLCDAASDADLDVIAQTTCALFPRVIWIGSAGLAEALARTSPVASMKTKSCLILRPMIFCIGSSHEVTRRQLACLVQADAVVDLSLDGALGVSLASASNSGKSLLLDMADTTLPRARLAKVLSQFIERGCTLVLSGGETAIQVCRALGATSLALEGELLAGVVFGRLRGGPAEGTQVITKSGAFGGPETLVLLESTTEWGTKIRERSHAR